MDVTQLNRLYSEPDTPCVLIQGSEWGDASFLSAWLTAAAEAEARWQKAFTEANFAEQMHDRVHTGFRQMNEGSNAGYRS